MESIAFMHWTLQVENIDPLRALDNALLKVRRERQILIQAKLGRSSSWDTEKSDNRQTTLQNGSRSNQKNFLYYTKPENQPGSRDRIVTSCYRQELRLISSL
jgi:hypothetical protein